jgi:hypothetical protein
MKSAIVTVLCVAGFAIWTPCHAQTQTVPVVITSDYYAQPKVLVLHALNNSGKDIDGYTIVIRHKKPDGTLDENGRSESMEDMLGPLVTSEMAKESGASESIRQQNAATAVFPKGYGIFLAGETRDKTLTAIESGSDVDAIAGAVFYTDGTYDEQDKDAFKRALTNRQGALQQMKEEDELIRNALADPANEHPVAAVLTELNKRRVEEMGKRGFFFSPGPSNLGNLQQRPAYGPMKGKSERERLTEFVEEQEKRVELMTPHCHLEIALKAEGPDSAK